MLDFTPFIGFDINNCKGCSWHVHNKFFTQMVGKVSNSGVVTKEGNGIYGVVKE